MKHILLTISLATLISSADAGFFNRAGHAICNLSDKSIHKLTAAAGLSLGAAYGLKQDCQKNGAELTESLSGHAVFGLGTALVGSGTTSIMTLIDQHEQLKDIIQKALNNERALNAASKKVRLSSLMRVGGKIVSPFGLYALVGRMSALGGMALYNNYVSAPSKIETAK